MVPIMNPNPTDKVGLFTFVDVTLVQYATVTGHLPGTTAANIKVKRKNANKVEVVQEDTGPMAYTLFPGFSKEMVGTIAVLPREGYTPWFFFAL